MKNDLNQIMKQNEKNKSCTESKKLFLMILKVKREKCENRNFFEVSKSFKSRTQHLKHESKSFYNDVQRDCNEIKCVNILIFKNSTI